MADRAQGRKKSNFVAKTTVEAGAFMDYFVNNYNYKISYANFGLSMMFGTGIKKKES